MSGIDNRTDQARSHASNLIPKTDKTPKIHPELSKKPPKRGNNTTTHLTYSASVRLNRPHLPSFSSGNFLSILQRFSAYSALYRPSFVAYPAPGGVTAILSTSAGRGGGKGPSSGPFSVIPWRRSSFPHPPWRGLRTDRLPSGEVVHRHRDRLPECLETLFIPPECPGHRGPGLYHDVTQYFIPDDKRPVGCIDLRLLCDLLRRQHFTTPVRPEPPHSGHGSGNRRFARPSRSPGKHGSRSQTTGPGGS